MGYKRNFIRQLNERLPEGFHLVAWSPGDGATRYRVVSEVDDYFGGHRHCDAMGAKAAEAMVEAFRAGFFAGVDDALEKING